jgi:hypothetical protein
MKIYHLYKITNKLNGASYIGCTGKKILNTDGVNINMKVIRKILDH